MISHSSSNGHVANGVSPSEGGGRDRFEGSWGPLRLGSRLIPHRAFLAPLAGYTQLAFRRAVRELGGLGLATTDLVQSTMLLSKRPKSMQLIATADDDKPLSVQIFGGKPHELFDAARWLEANGYGGIDINMGCPMAKVNGSGGGARLMCDTGGACSLVSGVVESVSVPVTVKMRLGWDDETINAPALAREFEQLGVVGVTVHGRTRAQGFGGTVNRDAIAAVVDAVRDIPIVANGDLRSVDDIIAMRNETRCAAVAIGRGAMLDPWLFRKLDDFVEGRPVREPSSEEQIQFLVRHFELMFEQHAEFGCILFRKFAAWYGATIGIPEDVEDRLRRIETDQDFYRLVDEIRRRPGERQSAIPTAFLKTPNGPNAVW